MTICAFTSTLSLVAHTQARRAARDEPAQVPHDRGHEQSHTSQRRVRAVQPARTLLRHAHLCKYLINLTLLPHLHYRRTRASSASLSTRTSAYQFTPTAWRACSWADDAMRCHRTCSPYLTRRTATCYKVNEHFHELRSVSSHEQIARTSRC